MKKKQKIKQPVSGKVAKVPVVMQLEALECGAASLAMVLAYYEKWVPLEQVRLDCGISRDGSNARNLLRAARNYGLNAGGYRFEPEDLRAHGTFPCIIHWNFNHFVVLNGFRGEKAVLNDPAKGTYTVPLKTFDESFTGVCLMFSPSESFVPEGKQRSMYAYAREHLTGSASAVVFLMLCSLITSLFGVISPVFSRIFLDRLLTHENPDWFVPFLLALGATSLVQLAVAWISASYRLRLEGRADVVGTGSFVWKILQMPMEFFSQRMAGDILSRRSSNSTIANSLVNTLAPLLLDAVMMIFYLAVMLRYSVALTAVGIASVLVNFFLSQIISKKRINLTRVQMRDAGKLSGTTVAGIEMIETIKASGAENGFFEKWSGYQAAVNTQKVRYQRLNRLLGLLPSTVSALCSATVLLGGVYLAMTGSFTVGMITAFQGFLSSFVSPVTSLIGAGQTVQEMRSEMERVEDVMKYPRDVCFDGDAVAERYDKLSGRVELKNVTFGYSRLAAPLIENFSMTLQPGSRVAFVGASGCGKSTLSNLISGLYQPWSGEILFDGKPLRDIDRSVFTGSLAVVDQDIILFEDTIANNIKMWDSSIEDFEMIMAARDAQLHEDIMQREGGYQYRLTEGGKDFSGGQRQRMEIARVLAQDPTIIILDEATSALDARTEYEVVKAIKDRGITCIVVAHRLSTVRDCDEIIVLDGGKAVERGTHDELMALGGVYTQLISNQ